MIASVVRVPWHTVHGGYDRLLDHLPEVCRITPPTGPLTTKAARRAHRLLARHCPLPFYPAEHFTTDLRLLASREPPTCSTGRSSTGSPAADSAPPP